jgi:protein-S-isoprenylcysteine O-methyltransferase Ste14
VKRRLIFLYGVVSYAEERDLVAEHPEYADYRKRVPMLVPFTQSA